MRTSFCPGQDAAACRPPGRGASLHSLPCPVGAQPAKGSWRHPSGPLEICSDQKVGLATPGQRRVPLLSGLPAAFAIPPSDPVCPLPSTSRGSPLAQNKSNPLILHGSQYPPLEYYFPHAHPVPLHSSFPSLPAAPQTCQAHLHPRAFALADPAHTLLAHLTQASAPCRLVRDLPYYVTLEDPLSLPLPCLPFHLLQY